MGFYKENPRDKVPFSSHKKGAWFITPDVDLDHLAETVSVHLRAWDTAGAQEVQVEQWPGRRGTVVFLGHTQTVGPSFWQLPSVWEASGSHHATPIMIAFSFLIPNSLESLKKIVLGKEQRMRETQELAANGNQERSASN